MRFHLYIIVMNWMGIDIVCVRYRIGEHYSFKRYNKYIQNGFLFILFFFYIYMNNIINHVIINGMSFE